MQFYTNATIVQCFENYIRYLFTHVNPYTCLSYGGGPTTIGYETGNELNGIKWGDKNVPTDWVREICQLIKKLGSSFPSPFSPSPLLIPIEGPYKLCIDGTYGIHSTHFAVDEVDIFSNHFYPLNNSILISDIVAVQSANHTYLAREIA